MKARILWPAITALVVVGVLSVMSAIGAENPKPDGEPPPGTTQESATQEQAGGEAIEATDTTAAGAAMEATDITAALSAEATGTTGQTTSSSTSTTLGATTSTTTPWVPPRTQHADWDDRLPGTRDGLRATACHSTFRAPVFDPPHSWDYDYKRDSGSFNSKEDGLIGFALSDSSWEPAPGTLLHKALANLRVASAQEIRDRGEAAMDVRWYAWFVIDHITRYGNPKHQSCASIIAGAEAVFAIKPTATPGSGTAVPKWTRRMQGRTPW